jgi:hypothetical protein
VTFPTVKKSHGVVAVTDHMDNGRGLRFLDGLPEERDICGIVLHQQDKQRAISSCTHTFSSGIVK